MPTGAMRTHAPLWLLLLCACGPGAEADLSSGWVDGDDPEVALVQELGARSPSDRLVVWQQNIEAMKAARVGPAALSRAMLGYAYRPDIVLLQEAWQKVLCGDYLDPDAPGNPDLNNFRESQRDAAGLARTCRLGRGPLPGSVLYRLGSALWGGAENLDHRRPFHDTLGSQSRTGVTVAWDRTRFVFEDSFGWTDADVPGCSTVLADFQRVAVLLRDTRRTASTTDDRLVAVTSVHYGSACLASANRWVAERMAARWGTFGGRPLALRLIGGDFNARVDEASGTYAARRREETPGSWYTRLTQNSTWRGGAFVDPVVARHGARGAGDSAGLCGQWTYPNVSVCSAKTACSEKCSGWGIGGQLDRLDYLFVSDGKGTFDPGRVLAAETNDVSYGYSDHKALRVALSWR